MEPKEIADVWNPDCFSESDLGAGERLKFLLDKGLLGKPLLFVEDQLNPKEGEWNVFNGKVWEVASTAYLKKLVDLMVFQVKVTAEEAFKTACTRIKNENPEEKKQKEALGEAYNEIIGFAKRFARKYNSEHGVTNALKAFRRLAPHVTGTAVFDADDWKLNVQDGLLDLRTGILEPHRPEHYCRKIFNASYNASSYMMDDSGFYSREFLPYITSLFPNSEVLWLYLSKVLGYALTGDTAEQKLFIFLGSGKNGKSSLCNLILGTWGDYGGVVPTGALLSSKADGGGESPSPQIDRLEGMRLVIAHEIPASMRKINEEKIKNLTGDAVITTRTLNKGGHSWRPRMKILMDVNDMFEISDPTAISLRRRIRAVPFKGFFQKADKRFMHLERDPRFRDALLRFALEGLRIVIADGEIDNWTGDWNNHQGIPTPVLQALREYYGRCDTISQLFEDILIVTGEPNEFMTVTKMFEYYRQEYGNTTMTLKSFAQKTKKILSERGCTYAVRFDGYSRGRGYVGVRVRGDADDIVNRPLKETINSTERCAPKEMGLFDKTVTN